MTKEIEQEVQDPVSREVLLESCNELFGYQEGSISIKGPLFTEDSWPSMNVEIKRDGNTIEDSVIAARLTYYLTDGTRPESFIYLMSEPGKKATASADNYWAKPGPDASAMPIRPPFDEFTDIPSIFLNHVILLTAHQYRSNIGLRTENLWSVNVKKEGR